MIKGEVHPNMKMRLSITDPDADGKLSEIPYSTKHFWILKKC